MSETLRCNTAALAVCLLAASAAADDAAKPSNPAEIAKLVARAATPGPAHKKLDVLAGRWTYTCKLCMEPGKSPVETTGTIERRWILGGRFLEERISGTGLDGKPKGFQGQGVLGHDNVRNKYIYTFLCTMGTGTSVGEGVATKSGGFSFRSQCSCPLEQKTVTGRDEIRVLNRNKIVMESYKTVGDQSVKVMELVAVRSK